jgi:dCMP deaminase
MKDRLSRDDLGMSMALVAAQRGTCNRKAIGAVIMLDGRPLSIGYVGSPAGMPHCLDEGCIIGHDGGCIRTQHAEANAIAWAARKGIPLEGSTMFVTVSPCLSCAKLIVNAGIRRVVSLEQYRIVDGFDYLRQAGVDCDILDK